MARLEDLTRGATVKGILPEVLVSVVDVEWHGDLAVTLTYKDAAGHLGSEILYRDREPTFDIATTGRPWNFDGDGALLRLVSEAYRIRLAYLFDPLLAVHTSLIEPLPHQITAVYGEMLPRQPLRFLLADDPGAGKTIMTGLLINELLLRGDLRRCLVVAPSGLVEQPNSSALGASSSQRHVPAGPRRDVQPVHSRLDQLLQPLLQDAVASDPEEDPSLCHPLGAPQVQAVAPEDQGSARLV